MARERLILPSRLRDDIVAHARAEAPRECCGLLLGDGETVQRILRCRNVADTPEVRYLVDPKELYAAVRASVDFDRELVAVYHSHPRSPALPSPTDRAEVRWPEALYVLVSLRWDEPEVNAYRIADGGVAKVPILSA